MPSPNFLRHAPHLISSIFASLFLCVKTLVGSAALCTGWRVLPGLQLISAGWGLGLVFAHLARSPVFFVYEPIPIATSFSSPTWAPPL